MLKNLKSLFIIEEEDPKADAAKAPEQPATPRAAPADTAQRTESADAPPGQINSKFTEVLLQAMERANVEGFDYLEFKRALQNLGQMPMDEPTRYRSAFAMAQTMGATPDRLIQTAQHYISALSQEEAQFQRAVANQQQKQVGTKQEQMQQLRTAIQQKEEQIRRLQTEIDQHRVELHSLETEISQASTKMEATRNDFIASYNHLVSQIEQDIENLRRYLAG